ncbi:hypothetical protein L1887_55825 [Cichorium endivia]|nr:hypothetical protein L1887_55825 [Cichorium endivia]
MYRCLSIVCNKELLAGKCVTSSRSDATISRDDAVQWTRRRSDDPNPSSSCPDRRFQSSQRAPWAFLGRADLWPSAERVGSGRGCIIRQGGERPKWESVPSLVGRVGFQSISAPADPKPPTCWTVGARPRFRGRPAFCRVRAARPPFSRLAWDSHPRREAPLEWSGCEQAGSDPMNRLACYRAVLYGQVVPAELLIEPTIITWNSVDSGNSDTGITVVEPSAVLQLPYHISLSAVNSRSREAISAFASTTHSCPLVTTMPGEGPSSSYL